MLPLAFTHRSFPNSPDINDLVGVLFGGVARPFSAASAGAAAAAPPRCAQCEAYLFQGCVWRGSRWRCGLCGNMSGDEPNPVGPKHGAIEWIDAVLSTRLAIICIVDVTCTYDVVDAVVRALASVMPSIKHHSVGLILCSSRSVSIVELGGAASSPCVVHVRVNSAGELSVPISLATSLASRALTSDPRRFVEALALVRARQKDVKFASGATLALAVDSLMPALEELAGAKLLIFTSASQGGLSEAARFHNLPLASVELFTDSSGEVPPPWTLLVSRSGGHVTELGASLFARTSDGLALTIKRRLPVSPVYRCLVKMRTVPELVLSRAGPPLTWWRSLFFQNQAPELRLLGDGCNLDGDTWSVASADGDEFSLGFELGFASGGGLEGMGYSRRPTVQVAAAYTRVDESSGKVLRCVRVETRTPLRESAFEPDAVWPGIDAPVVAWCLLRQALSINDSPIEARASVQAWAERVASASGDLFLKHPLCRLVYGMLQSPELGGVEGFHRPKLAHLLGPTKLAKYLWPRLVAVSDQAHELALVKASLSDSASGGGCWILDAVSHLAVVGSSGSSSQVLAQLRVNPDHTLAEAFALDLTSQPLSSPFSPGATEEAHRIAVDSFLWEDAFIAWRQNLTM